MKDNDVKDLVIAHDKHIEVMSQSIEHLADAVGTTNRKMEDIIEVLSNQQVQAERLSNMDENLRESFERVHNKIANLEEHQEAAVPPYVIKWALALLVTYAITFGTYFVQSIHTLETRSETHLSVSKVRDANVDKKLNKLDSYLNRNYGLIKGISSTDKDGR